MTKEILEKLKGARTEEEALTILKENSITLTDDDLQAISGGLGFLPDLWKKVKDAAKEIAQDAAAPVPAGMVINHNMTGTAANQNDQGGPLN